MSRLVIGIDAGATTTRCLVVTGEGGVVGSATGAGANIRSSGGGPQARFADLLVAALGGRDPETVAAGVIGAGAAGVSVLRAAADMAWWQVGMSGRPRVVTDLEVAFAAGTSAPDGLLLLAGTGAAAASFRSRRIVCRCDGYGWLLGDEGSAVWLGLRGIRAALDAQDGRGPPTRLGPDLAAHLGLSPGADLAPGEDLAQALTARIRADQPARIAALAPLVTRAAAAGDEVARGLVDAAAERLVAAVRAVAAGPVQDQPVQGELVLAGGLVSTGPVREAVLARLAGASVTVRDAGPGAAGAAALALADLGALDAELHRAVLRAAATSA